MNFLLPIYTWPIFSPPELLQDQYGNYLSQKILEVATPAQFETLFAKVEHQMHLLAREVHVRRRGMGQM